MKSSNKVNNRRAGTPSLIVGLSLAVIAAVIALIVSSQTNRNQEQKPVAQISSQDSSVSSSTNSKTESKDESKTEDQVVKRSGLEIKYIDVGQGNSTLVKLPDGKNLLIDAGSKEYSDKLVSYLKNEKIEKIDYLIATNADANDIGGMPSIIKSFDIGRVYTPDISESVSRYEDEKSSIEAYESFTKALSEKKLTPLNGSSGTHIYFSLSLTIDVIAPNDSAYSELNNYSIAVMIKYGQQKFIFMSDAENYSEQEILDKEYDVAADVIMVGDHGSSTASGKSFIKKVAPKYAVISCGAGNSEGYPHQETLKTLEENEIKVFRTDLNGTITLKSDGMNELIMTPEKEASKENSVSSSESSSEDSNIDTELSLVDESSINNDSTSESEVSDSTEESVESAA